MTQTANTQGHCNIIVQVNGDKNSIVVNQPYLELIPPARHVPVGPLDNSNMSELLNPYRRTIPLIGREEDMRGLRAWLADPQRIAVRTLTGRGGAGKTRLALELLEEIAGEGWRGGLAKPEELRRFARQENMSRWGWQGQTLVVVDYAATSTEALGKMLRELAGHPALREDGKKLRILLLEREADMERGWLHRLLPDGWERTAVMELFQPPQPIELTTLTEDSYRRAVLMATFEKAAALSHPAPCVPELGDNERFDAQLALETWGDPLMLMMAAVAALTNSKSGMLGALSLKRADLARTVAQHELGRIRQFAPDTDNARRLLGHLTTDAVMAGGVTQAEAQTLAQELCEQQGCTYPDGYGELARDLWQALTINAEGKATIIPDILAEAVTLEALGREATEHEIAQILVTVAQRHRAACIAFLIHLAQDFATPEYQVPVQWLELLIAGWPEDRLALLIEIENVLPIQSTTLVDFSIRIGQEIIESLEPVLINTCDYKLITSFARSCHNLSIYLSGAGKYDEGIEVALKELKVLNFLEHMHPGSQRADITACLNNVVNHLCIMKRYNEALPIAVSVLESYKLLADECPKKFRKYYAISLNSIGNVYKHIGSIYCAISSTKLSIEILDDLIIEFPDDTTVNNYLAGSLYSLAYLQSLTGDYCAATTTIIRVIGIRRVLVSQLRSTYLPDLAMSLNVLAICHNHLNRYEEALQAAEEAIDYYDELAKIQPDAYIQELALLLNTQANILRCMGRYNEGITVSEQSVQKFEILVSIQPGIFNQNFSLSLNTLAGLYGLDGQLKAAYDSITRAISIRESLARDNPNAYNSDLAESLINLAIIFLELTQYEEAITTIDRSIDLYKELAHDCPRAFTHELAHSLAVKCSILGSNGNYIGSRGDCKLGEDQGVLGISVE